MLISLPYEYAIRLPYTNSRLGFENPSGIIADPNKCPTVIGQDCKKLRKLWKALV